MGKKYKTFESLIVNNMTLQGINDPVIQIAFFKNHLRDSAVDFFDQLPHAKKDDIMALRKAFREQYVPRHDKLMTRLQMSNLQYNPRQHTIREFHQKYIKMTQQKGLPIDDEKLAQGFIDRMPYNLRLAVFDARIPESLQEIVNFLDGRQESRKHAPKNAAADLDGLADINSATVVVNGTVPQQPQVRQPSNPPPKPALEQCDFCYAFNHTAAVSAERRCGR